MGRKEHLVRYWRKLRGLAIEKALIKYGIPDKIHLDKGTLIQSTLQRVTRRGIKVNGKEYWDDDLISKYLGRTVNVVATPDGIRVEDMDKSVITTFTPACP